MPLSLLNIAEKQGIVVEYWDFTPPLEAVYWVHSDLPPHIGISNKIVSNRSYFRCILAEEIGHHFTTTGNAIPRTYFHYRDRLEVSKAEYQALKWASLYLMPSHKLINAIKKGVQECWEFAEYFDVTEDMVKFRFELPDAKNLTVIRF
ncbi:ImmA/IrrE family metallo-endopeptidase [Paenibacillus naphthalenovorans]|uniref:ImmA/IrrE family metallo-endopeptidase n=1 Tax=Paenibacillus naphthalenovorans TaxID=162209 RepID=UPI003D2AC125